MKCTVKPPAVRQVSLPGSDCFFDLSNIRTSKRSRSSSCIMHLPRNSKHGLRNKEPL